MRKGNRPGRRTNPIKATHRIIYFEVKKKGRNGGEYIQYKPTKVAIK